MLIFCDDDDDDNDNDNDDGKAAGDALSLLLYFPSTPTTPVELLKSSWMLQPTVVFISQQHLTLLTTSSFQSDLLPVASLTRFSWSSCYPSGLLNSMTSWEYPFEGLLITVMIRSKLLNRVHKAFYDLATAFQSHLLLLSFGTMSSVILNYFQVTV